VFSIGRGYWVVDGFEVVENAIDIKSCQRVSIRARLA
jgi:hypothetical protein